jgi:predicted glycoside hydrolase/deacetylase ChbG (UPF0249 family)
MPGTNLIINADDFGINAETTHAIMAAMDSGLCLDTTLLVNFENSEHAAKLAISNKRKDHVGIHLNLTEGKPLSTRIQNERLFCNEEGLFHYKKQKRILKLSIAEKKAVCEEITSQIRLCRSFGIPISHADSHNHIHEEPGLFLLLINILKKEKIPFLRLTNNLEKVALPNRIYRNSCNYILNTKKISGTNYFGSTSDFRNSTTKFQSDAIVELMIHPGQESDNQIYDVYSNENLSQVLPEIIKGNRLISYNQLSKY